MEITVSSQQGVVPVTVVQPHGDVDASNHTQLISKVESLVKSGARDFLLDLSDVPYMSSAGLVALHTIAILLRGEKPVEAETGWSALKSIDRAREAGTQRHVKLFKPQQFVAETFEKAGFTQLFEVFDDMQRAVASFA
jgi:anti-sigma B factor antagonist